MARKSNHLPFEALRRAFIWSNRANMQVKHSLVYDCGPTWDRFLDLSIDGHFDDNSLLVKTALRKTGKRSLDWRLGEAQSG